MIFSSSLFLFIFLPVVLLVYYISANSLKNAWLLAASLVFYSWGEPKYIFLMLTSIVLNYAMGICMEKFSGRRKTLMLITVIANIGMLEYFKYFNFIAENIGISVKNIALPIGISFYTFQSMSYVIDVYRGQVKAQRNIFDLALYISLFPQLIAGPIVRYKDIEEQLHGRFLKPDKFGMLYDGIKLFIIGFSKKVLIADQLAPLVNTVFEGNGMSAPVAWVGAVAYAFQIYYDFSGYSDMARGLGKMLGFEFMENFNYPYISRSIKEFWRRWHISLSTWFRDYLYIPLGGSRVSVSRSYINLFTVFIVTGIWHGASWNFVVWGLYYAFFQILEKAFLGKILDKAPKAVGYVYTLSVVIFGWILFRAENLTSAISYMKNLFLFDSGSVAHLISTVNLHHIICLIVATVFSVPSAFGLVKKLLRHEIVQEVAYIALFIIAISYMVGSGFSPFLYFRF